MLSQSPCLSTPHLLTPGSLLPAPQEAGPVWGAVGLLWRSASSHGPSAPDGKCSLPLSAQGLCSPPSCVLFPHVFAQVKRVTLQSRTGPDGDGPSLLPLSPSTRGRDMQSSAQQGHREGRGSLRVDGKGCLPNIHIELIETKQRISFYYNKTLRLSVAGRT